MSNELSYFNLGGTNIPVCDEEARTTLQNKTDKTYVDGLIAGVNNQLTGKLDKSSVVNNLTSTSASDPLSANMGRTLQSEIDTIDTKLSVNTFLQATPSEGYEFTTQSANGFPISGNTGTAYYSGSWSTAVSITPSTVIATIPETIRPVQVQYVMAYYSTGSAWLPCTAVIRPNGSITVNITNASVSFILICGSFGI